MTFEEWREGEQWNDHCNPTDFAKAAWDYQQKRIDELETVVKNTLEDNLDLTDGDNCTLYDLKKSIGWD
jgi:hypothetical protein